MSKELLIVLLVVAVLFAVAKWWPRQEKELGPPPDATLRVQTLPEDASDTKDAKEK